MANARIGIQASQARVSKLFKDAGYGDSLERADFRLVEGETPINKPPTNGTTAVLRFNGSPSDPVQAGDVRWWSWEVVLRSRSRSSLVETLEDLLARLPRDAPIAVDAIEADVNGSDFAVGVTFDG